jgi:16S rRNA G966 N2-methylase RsmD
MTPNNHTGENLSRLIRNPDKTSDFIAKHRHDDIRKLALQAAKYPDVDFHFALQQIAGKQIAAVKIPSWSEREDIRYPVHLSLEQCSSEITARYKASLFRGGKLVDLTGGFGVDCAFLSGGFEEVAYVEQKRELCETAHANFRALSLNHIKVCNSQAEIFLKEMFPADCIFLDPARRDRHGQKTVLISDCEPDAGKLQEELLKKAPTVWIKYSPMLDISLAVSQLPKTTEIHVIAVDNECKELLFKMESGAEPEKEPVIRCVNLKKNDQIEYFTFKRTEENSSACVFAGSLCDYLYEPNAAVLKAGAFRCLTQHYEIHKLHKNSHLYTSDTSIPNFPGRVFRIKDFFSLNKKESRKSLSGLMQANISVRNFPLTVNELRKKTGLKEGGEMYLFATTLKDEKRVIIRCEKL